MTALAEIESDLDWRESELAIMRISLSNEKVSQREKLVLFRAGWALLYAHYEGYCKFALSVFYDALSKSGQPCEQLAVPTQVFALSDEMKALRSLPASELFEGIRTFEANHLSSQATFPDVDTKSNLWPNNLKDLLRDADIEVQSVDSFSNKLKTLVARRNKIAHGEKDIIDEFSYYLGFEDAVLTVMYDLAFAIEERLVAQGVQSP